MPINNFYNDQISYLEKKKEEKKLYYIKISCASDGLSTNLYIGGFLVFSYFL